MVRVGLILNGLALLPAIGGAIGLGLLGGMFLGSPDSSDKLVGWLMMLVGCPLMLAGPLLGGWLALNRPQAAQLSCLIGGVCLLIGALSLLVLPKLIEAAARP